MIEISVEIPYTDSGVHSADAPRKLGKPPPRRHGSGYQQFVAADVTAHPTRLSRVLD